MQMRKTNREKGYLVSNKKSQCHDIGLLTGQPRSQAFSPLPPLSLGERPWLWLVA